MKNIFKFLSIILLSVSFIDTNCMNRRIPPKYGITLAQLLQTSLDDNVGHGSIYALSLYYNQIYNFNCQISCFKKSQENEFKDYIIFAMATCKKNYRDTKIDLDEEINYLKSNSYELTSQYLSEQMPNYIPIFKDISQTFNKLKEIMQIPDEVKIKFLIKNKDNINTSYYPNLRTIVITDKALSNSKSDQLFKLIHELTHALQHIKYELFFLTEFIITKKQIEKNADILTSNAIKCSLCIKIEANLRLPHDKTIRTNGFYLTGQELLTIANSKLEKDLCTAHKLFKDLLQSKDLKEMVKKDKESGTLYDRLDTLNFDHQL